MSDDNSIEISDHKEQKIWDGLVDMIVKSARSAQKIQFYKYKLSYHIQTNQIANGKNNSLNSINAIYKLENNLENLTDNFHKDYLSKVKNVKELIATNQDKPRIEIMLDTAKSNLKKILTYNELHAPTMQELKSKIITLSAETPKPAPDDLAPTHQQS